MNKNIPPINLNHKKTNEEIRKSNILLHIIIPSIVCVSTSVSSQIYEVPPSTTTSSNVPYISDSAMEQCVKIYNEAKWLEKEIETTHVNQYSQPSINAYNSKVTKQSAMIIHFNQNCAGKQSESAYRAAKKLNQQ
jgi:hypothetical protein